MLHRNWKITTKTLATLILGVFGLLRLSSAVCWAQSSASLLATTDFDCTWKLDGQSQGQLKADDSKVTVVSPGKHLVQATTTDGLSTFRTIVEVGQGQELVEIRLKVDHNSKVAAVDAEQHPTWTDPATGLMWAKKDNGSKVDWHEASNYCANLQLGGYSGWRLPTIDELQGIYDQTQNISVNYGLVHVKGNLQLSGAWSNSAGNSSDEAWLFYFGNGKRVSGVLWGRGYDASAECVRRSGA
jgi:hypothetical protein